jgi:hypothetical protein
MEVPSLDPMFSKKCLSYLTKHAHRKGAQMLMTALFGLGILGVQSPIMMSSRVLKRLSVKQFKLLTQFAKTRKLANWKSIQKEWKKQHKARKVKKE